MAVDRLKASDEFASLDIGQRIKTMRKAKGLSLAEIAKLTGLSEATLSRVENNQTLVSAHSLYILAKTLDADITAFFEHESRPLSTGIRSICRKGQGVAFRSARYFANVLCTDLSNKKMHPSVNCVTITDIEAAGGLSRHEGEEFVYVLDGVMTLVTEFYEPVRLETGDSVYFDSQMGHAYLAADGAPVRILVVTTTEPPVPRPEARHG